MKHLLSMSVAAALALTTIGSTAALAQPYQPGPPPGAYYNGPGGPGWHHWHRGDRFRGQRYVVNDWHRYHLRRPPYGYQWVRDGGQFVLIGISTGIVADIFLSPR